MARGGARQPALLSVFAWSDTVPCAACTLLAGTVVTVVGHLVPTVEHGLEVFVDAVATDLEGALDGSAVR